MPTRTPAPTSTPSFPGFEVPKQNYFKLPNNWTDITADIGSIAELKVVEYVLRHTWGYQEYGISKQISIDEFMSGRKRADGGRIDKGTGLAKTSVIAGLKAAVARGLLLEETDDSDLGRVKKYYRLRMAADAHGNAVFAGDEAALSLEENEAVKPDKQAGYQNRNSDVQNSYPPVQNSYPRGKESVHRTEKDTLERHQQEKQEKNNNNNAVAPPPSAGTSKAKAVVVASLVHFGIGRSVAQELAGSFDTNRIQEKIEFLEFLTAERPDDVKKPAAWLRRAIERDFGAPDGFVTAADRERHAKQEKERTEALLAAQNERSERERVQQKEQEARRAAERERLRQKYATKTEDEALWTSLLENVQVAGNNALFGLLAHSQLLTLDDEKLTIAVPAGVHATQLESERMESYIKRVLKRLTKNDYKLQFLPVDGLA